MMFLNTLSIIIALLISDVVGALQWWNGWSPQDNNDRYQRKKLPVTPASAKTEFKERWYTKLDGPVEVSPTIYENYVYVSTFAGSFYCLQADNGVIVWQRNLTDTLENGHLFGSRTSALVYNNMIILGLSDGSLLQLAGGYGCFVVALNRFTGALIWQSKVSSHPASIITATPQLADNRLFIGISSYEETFALIPTYPCCSFQGSVVALKARTGKFLWERKMIPDNNGTATGYSGAAVWGSQFPVDHRRNRIYIGTGNYYKLPASVEQCLTETSNLTLLSDPCNEPGAYGQAILALDMDTGLVRWSRNLGSIIAWTEACHLVGPVRNANCPPNPGTDSDFAQAPILKLNLKYKFGGTNRDQLFVGQKSGIVFGIDAETGTIIWSNQVSPGSESGGIQFGSAADDHYIYVGNNNGDGLKYRLLDGTTTRKASWSALELVTGDVKWTTVDPTKNINQTSAYRPLTVWDQLVLVQGGSQPPKLDTATKGCLYGLNKANGHVLYEKCINNTPIGSGASVVKDTIYVGIGYRNRRAATDGVMALQLPCTP